MRPSRIRRPAGSSSGHERDPNTHLMSHRADATTNASEAAWAKHVDSLSPTERQYFEKEELRLEGAEAYISAISIACQGLQDRSRGIKTANWIRPFFRLYNFLTPTLSAMSAASPLVTPTPFILGAITCIMQISSNFAQYQEKLGEILQDMILQLSILLKYEKYVYQDDEEIQEALVDIYGDILNLCRKALRLFMNEKGKVHGSGTTFLKSLTGSFDTHFEDEKKSFQRHLQIFKEIALLRDRLQDQQHYDSAGRFQQHVGRSLNTIHEFHSTATRAFVQSQDILTSRYEQKSLVREREMLFRDQEKKAQMRDTILEWIPAVDFERTHDNVCDNHLEGTCDWFLSHDAFQSWIESENSSLLWVKGKAGSGKSVLAGQTIQYLEDFTTNLTYVYCDALPGPEGSTTEDGDEMIVLLGSILKQLCQAQADIEPAVEQLHSRVRGQKKSNSGSQALRKALLSVLADRDATTLIVDGLDECEEIEKIAKFLLSLVKEQEMVVKLMVFSRPNYRPIETAFAGYPQVIVDSGANEEDLEAFIQVQLEKVGFDLRRHELFFQEVQNAMLEKSEGMFLWVQLVVPSLKEHRRQEEIIRSLDSVPIGLTEVYDSAIKKIFNLSPVERQETLRILLWTANAARPMSSDEILEAVMIEPGIRSSEGVLALSAAAVVQSCADLIIVDKDGCFRLVHSSLKEYLQSLPPDSPPHILTYRDMQDNSDKILAETCLTYLLFDEFQESSPGSEADVRTLLEHHALLDYASSYWASHFEKSKDSGLQELATELLNQPHARETCLQVYLRDVDDEEDSTDFPSSITVLHIISLYGLVTIACDMPEVAKLVGSTDTRGRTPLDYALLKEHVNMCIWLLKLARGQPQEYLNIRGLKSPLRRAALCHWYNVLELSIELGEDVNDVYYKSGNTALHCCAIDGFLDGVQILVSSGANLDSLNFWGDTPLMCAADSNHEEIMTALVNAGALVDAKDALGKTALHYAAFRDSINNAELLLRHGSDPNNRADKYQTPLHGAAQFNAFGVIKLLHAAGADLFAKSSTGSTAFHYAVENGSRESAECILALASEKNADTATLLSSAEHFGYNVLHIAADNGDAESVQLFLRSEASIEEKTAHGLTALHLAVWRNHKHVFQDLIRSGADVATISCDGAGLMHAAAKGNSLNMIQPLQDAKVNCESRNHNGETPLHIAAQQGHLEFVTRLLKILPMEIVNATSKEDQTALHDASREGHFDIVRLLLQYGARLSPNVDGDTPLHLAAENNHRDVLELFITPDTVGSRGHLGMSALHYAARNGNNDIVTLLMERGADIDLDDEHCRSPLFTATSAGHEDTVRLLLARGADLRASTPSEKSLLREAVGSLSLSLIALLLEKGLDPCDKNSIGHSVFLKAVYCDRMDIVKLLLSKGINGSNDVDKFGQTCAHVMVQNDNIEMFDLLRDAGMELGSLNYAGLDAAGYAVAMGAHHLVERMLRNGCSIENTNGLLSPLQVAASFGSLTCIETLLSLGAEVDGVTRISKSTPLLMATSGGRSFTAARLVKAGASLIAVDESGLTPLDYARQHLPTRTKLIESGFSVPGESDMNISRRKPAFRLITALTKSFSWKSYPNTTEEQFLRWCCLADLAQLLLFRNDQPTLSCASLCLMETSFSFREGFGLVNASDCNMCDKSIEHEDLYLCVYCKVELCGACHALYLIGGDAARSAPKGFANLLQLEKDTQDIEECVLSVSHSPDLLISLLGICPIFERWLEWAKDSYDEWDTYDNTEEQFGASKRPGHAFVEVLDKILPPRDGQQDDLAKNYLGNMYELQKLNKNRKLFREFQGFTCSGHEYFRISFDEWEKAKVEGKDLDARGAVRKEVFEHLLNFYEQLEKEESTSSLEADSKHVMHGQQGSSATDDVIKAAALWNMRNANKDTYAPTDSTDIEYLSLSENICKEKHADLEGKNEIFPPSDKHQAPPVLPFPELRDKFLDVTLDPYDAFKLISAHIPSISKSQHLALVAGRASNFISGEGNVWFQKYEEFERRRLKTSTGHSMQ